MKRLNDDFGLANITFDLKGYRVIPHDRWANNQDDAQMRRTLRQGGYSTLNLYYVDAVKGTGFFSTVTGLCNYPREVALDAPSTYPRDGCLILSSQLGYRTSTHEIGHWLGLMHTFQDDCSGEGDYVDDTPPHDTPTELCFPWARTCDGGRSLELAKNYMNNLPSSCSTDFTPGQALRMRSMWNRLRRRNVST